MARSNTAGRSSATSEDLAQDSRPWGRYHPKIASFTFHTHGIGRGSGTACRSDGGCRCLMCRYQNCWRGDETLARKTFEHVVVVRVMIVTIAEASAASMLLGPGKYSIFRRNPAADSLQMQRR